jgi:tRNA(Ile)-lysidine synthase
MVPSTADFNSPAGLPDPGRLLELHPELADANSITVAYSGGVDSTVLLVLLAKLRQAGSVTADVLALHVNHALNPAADDWQRHCGTFCQEHGIAFDSVRVAVSPLAGESLEMAARRERYRVFSERLPGDGLLLQGHHQGDQAETFLYRLMRGNGPGGLGAIPAKRKLGQGTVLRPMLAYTRPEIMAYARAAGLQWVEDPSNASAAHDRNYLRNSILPLLEARWPHAGAAISYSASLCREAGELLAELAGIDLATASAAPGNRLRTEPLSALGESRQRNMLKHWLEYWSKYFGGAHVTRKLLLATVRMLTPHPGSPACELQWGSGRETLYVRRYRNHLYVLPPLPPCREQHWDTGDVLALSPPLGELSLEPTGGPGIPAARIPSLSVRYRAGGESIKPPMRPTRTVKNLMQEHGVPPWMRDHVPLLYHDDELVAIGDLATSADWWQSEGRDNVRLVWKRSDLDCGY